MGAATVIVNVCIDVSGNGGRGGCDGGASVGLSRSSDPPEFRAGDGAEGEWPWAMCAGAWWGDPFFL